MKTRWFKKTAVLLLAGFIFTNTFTGMAFAADGEPAEIVTEETGVFEETAADEGMDLTEAPAAPEAPVAPEAPEAPEAPAVDELDAEEANALINEYNNAVDEYNEKADAYNAELDAYESEKAAYNEKAAAYNAEVEKDNAEAEEHNRAEAEKEEAYAKQVETYNQNLAKYEDKDAQYKARVQAQNEKLGDMGRATKDTIQELGTVLSEDYFIKSWRGPVRIGKAGDLAVRWEDLKVTNDRSTIQITQNGSQDGEKYKVANFHVFQDFTSFADSDAYYAEHGYDCMNINLDDENGIIIIPAALIDRLAYFEYEVAEFSESDSVTVTGQNAVFNSASLLINRYFEGSTQGGTWMPALGVFAINAADYETDWTGTAHTFTFANGTCDNSYVKNPLNVNTYQLYKAYSNVKPVSPEEFTPEYREMRNPVELLGESIASRLGRIAKMELIKAAEAVQEEAEEEKAEVIPAGKNTDNPTDTTGGSKKTDSGNATEEAAPAIENILNAVEENTVPAAAPAVTAPAARTAVTGTAVVSAPAAAVIEAEETAESAKIEEAEIAESEMPLAASLTENDIPAAAPAAAESIEFFALINLILAVLTAIMALGMIGTYFRGKEDNEEEEGEKKHRAGKFLGIIPAAAGIIAFILTEDITNPMQLTDRWTILMAVIFAAGLATAYFTRNRKQEEEESEAEVVTA